MLDNILIIVILTSLISSFFIVKIWKGNHFVKELYIAKSVYSVFYVIIIAITIGLIIIYFVTSRGTIYSWLYLVIVLVFDLLLLFTFGISATTCIYLKDNILIHKNIFYSKQILINENIKIIEKTDRKIIKSEEKSIVISSRYLTGNINNLMNRIYKLRNT